MSPPRHVVPPGAERRFMATLPSACSPTAPPSPSSAASVSRSAATSPPRPRIGGGALRPRRACLLEARPRRRSALIFRAQPRTLPNASIDWTEFSTTDIEQLVFVMHSMLGTVCEALARDGMGARSITVTLALEGGKTLLQQVGSGRPSFDRKLWLRLVRRALERITLPDRVAGIAIEVDGAGAPPIRQGDLFDLGFASAQAAEAAVAHVIDLQPDAVVVAERTEHMLPEGQVRWKAELAPDLDEMRGPLAVSHKPSDGQMPSDSQRLTADSPACIGYPQLALKLLPSPRQIDVLSKPRRGFPSPVRYTDNGPSSAQPEPRPQCLSGNHAEAAYSREYYQGVRGDARSS